MQHSDKTRIILLMSLLHYLWLWLDLTNVTLTVCPLVQHFYNSNQAKQPTLTDACAASATAHELHIDSLPTRFRATHQHHKRHAMFKPAFVDIKIRTKQTTFFYWNIKTKL
jgi:hypothetical protein